MTAADKEIYALDVQRRLSALLVANARAVWELAEQQLAAALAEQQRVEREIACCTGQATPEDYIV